jgi:hypothetical protein
MFPGRGFRRRHDVFLADDGIIAKPALPPLHGFDKIAA